MPMKEESTNVQNLEEISPVVKRGKRIMRQKRKSQYIESVTVYIEKYYFHN